MTAWSLMIQGTASGVGKSLICAGICRALYRRGVDVVPFKAQNMSLNAAVTSDGGEIGRAQALQAIACGKQPDTLFNPILLKPESEGRSQVIVHGRPVSQMDAATYYDSQDPFRQAIAASLSALKQRHEAVIIEGAGSPAEINLRGRDLANMYVARLAAAPVVLVGDIERGGVFASLYGTWALLEEVERQHVLGFLINRFRGRGVILRAGLEELEQRTGVATLGVVPHIRQLCLPDEDHLDVEPSERESRVEAGSDELRIAVIRLPKISNTDDFTVLAHEPGVSLSYVHNPAALGQADLVVIPGSKSTIDDLAWLRQRGFDQAIHAMVRRGRPVLGICGGCQMLGRAIDDTFGIEGSARRVDGLGLLPGVTVFDREKVTRLVRYKLGAGGFFGYGDFAVEARGYVIHAGRFHSDAGACAGMVAMGEAGEYEREGAASRGRRIFGTMVHGLFDDSMLRGQLLREVAVAVGKQHWRIGQVRPPSIEDELDRLAQAIEGACDLNKLFKQAASWHPLPSSPCSSS